MTYLINNNHTLLILLVLIGGYKVFSFTIDLFRALPLMYYCWRVTSECPDAHIHSDDEGFYIKINLSYISCGNTPTAAWKAAWSFLKTGKNSTT